MVLTGVGPVLVLTALAGLEAAGVTFLVAAVPVVVAGFEALLVTVFAGVFLTGVAAGFDGVAVLVASVTAAGVLRTGSFFCVRSGVLALAAGVAAAVPAAGKGVAPAPAALSFLGTFLTGVAAVSVVPVAVLVAFLTGGMGVVFDAEDVAALAGVEAVVFFVAGVLLAVLATLLTLAGRWH